MGAHWQEEGGGGVRRSQGDLRLAPRLVDLPSLTTSHASLHRPMQRGSQRTGAGSRGCTSRPAVCVRSARGSLNGARAVVGHGHKNYLRPRQQARARGTARRHGWGAHGRAAASCIQVNTCRARSGSSPTPTVCRVAAAPGLRLLALAACLVLRPRVCASAPHGSWDGTVELGVCTPSQL